MTPKHTLIYPQKQDAGRAQSRPPGATMGGPVPNGPRSQAWASSGPCPASLTTVPLEGDPRPSRAEAGKSLRLPRFQDLPKTNTSGLIPRFFNFPGQNSGGILSLVEIISRYGLRSDCGSFHKLPGPPRGPGFGMTRVSLACVRPPPGGPDRVFPASRPSRGVVSCVALGLPGHPPKGVVSRFPPRGVLRDCSRPVPGLCRGVVSPLTGGFPHNSARLRHCTDKLYTRGQSCASGGRGRAWVYHAPRHPCSNAVSCATLYGSHREEIDTLCASMPS